MGWLKSAAWCAATAGVVVAAGACGGADESNKADPKASAGTTTAGGASGGGSGSHAGGTAAGQSAGGSAVSGGSSAGGSSSSGGTAAGGGASGGSVSLFIDQLRAREGCLPRALPIVETAGSGFEVGQVRCIIIEVIAPQAGATCACDASQSLKPTETNVFKAVKQQAQASGACGGQTGVSCDSLCACDLSQSTGAALAQCQTDAVTPIAQMPPGFCYVDATLTPPLGNAAVVASCPADARRGLRVLGPVPNPAPMLFLGCTGASL